MGKALKILVYSVGAVLTVFVVAAVLVAFLFDPHDYREDISAQVELATGREFTIEGDLSLSIFPWVAIEVGRTQLGNAEGFSDTPMLSFEKASLSIKVLPLIFGQEISIGTAELDSLAINLEVNEQGVTNWQDLSDRSEAAEQLPAEVDTGAAPAGDPTKIDVSSIDVSNASLTYTNRQLGETYELSDLGIQTGSVFADEPIELDAGFSFSAQPADVTGRLDLAVTIAFDNDNATISVTGFSIDGSAEGVAEAPVTLGIDAPAMTFNTEARSADVGEINIALLDVRLAANVEPFSYADSPTPSASITIDAFSPRSLMEQMGIEPPATADPNAFSKLMLSASANIGDDAIRLSNLELTFDDTTFKGQLVVPRDSNGMFELDLAGDSLDVTRYMAPAGEATEEAAPTESVPVEIPVDLIRTINARGNLTLDNGKLGKMAFSGVALGVNANAGKVRFHPITAQFFEGRYVGDTRIDATGDLAVLTVDERIENVSLESLARAMMDQENITGQINGQFQLSGRGNDMAAIQRSLNGNMAMVLSDGAFEGTDVWYQLRRARAAFRRTEPPEPTLPARTRFSEVSATGQVRDGILTNNDFVAKLPFMQLEGRGTVNLPAATVDYSLSGRVVEKPELMDDVSAEEIADLTKAMIPLRITGPLAAPDISVDIESMVKEQVQDEIEDTIKDKLKDLFNR